MMWSKLPLQTLRFPWTDSEPPRTVASLGVSPMPLFPKGKEGFGSVTSYAEKAVFFIKESPCISSARLCYFTFYLSLLIDVDFEGKQFNSLFKKALRKKMLSTCFFISIYLTLILNTYKCKFNPHLSHLCLRESVHLRIPESSSGIFPLVQSVSRTAPD